MCINRACDEVSFLCCVRWLGAKESGGGGEGNQWQITRAQLVHCTVGMPYSKDGTSKMMQPNGGWTPRSFFIDLEEPSIGGREGGGGGGCGWVGVCARVMGSIQYL